MSGAQAKAAVIAGCIGVVAEVSSFLIVFPCGQNQHKAMFNECMVHALQDANLSSSQGHPFGMPQTSGNTNNTF